jgi:serine protease
MQVNNKSLFLIFGITVILLFVFGCTTEPKSSISGKITIYADGNQSAKSTSQSSVSIETVPDKKSKVLPVPEFIPDEIIVKYKSGVDSLYTAKSTSGSGYITASSIKNSGNGTMELLRLDRTEKTLLSSDSVKDRTLKEIERLNNLSSVEYAEPNYIFKALFVPNDPYYSVDKRQWSLPLIKLDKVWGSLSDLNDLSTVTVAVIDTGIARKNGTTDHQDLSSIFRDEYDFINDNNVSKDGEPGRDSDATDPPTANTGFHGTHVAGTIGALTNNSYGVAGVAGGDSSAGNKGVWIMPLRVLGLDGVGYAYDIAQAILYAAKLPNASGALPAGNRADIINMSFGSTANSQSIMLAINAAYNEGVTLVAAAGNEGGSLPIYPAAYPNVISVAAVGAGAERAGYSNYGDKIDITAPGGDTNFDLNNDENLDGILSTTISIDNTDGYIYFEGTSMAAPHVTGAAAIIVAGLRVSGATVTPSEVKRILINNAIDMGFPEFYGSGLLNVYSAACEALSQTQGALLHPFPKTVRVGATDSTGTFTLKNIGDGGSITIDNISEE